MGCCKCRQVASKVTIDGEVIPFEMLAKEGVSEVNGFVSRVVGEVGEHWEVDRNSPGNRAASLWECATQFEALVAVSKT